MSQMTSDIGHQEQSTSKKPGWLYKWTHPDRTTLIGMLLGLAVLLAPSALPPLPALGLQAAGPILGIALVVFSLFGDLPKWVAWTQTFGAWLFPGIALGTILLLIPLLVPTGAAPESSFFAFSPTVWAAYISIVLVSISFAHSFLPEWLYDRCRAQSRSPATLIPLYVIFIGLLGNILDGVSIIAISVVIFLHLLEKKWAIRASFALLFGGLISNLITVAAEPTNIKFQDVLHTLLDHVTPSYWATNWPISVLGILLPAAWLAYRMRWGEDGKVDWRKDDGQTGFLAKESLLAATLSIGAILLLAGGIVYHAVLQAKAASSATPQEAYPLWVLLLPAGLVAILHLITARQLKAVKEHIFGADEEAGAAATPPAQPEAGAEKQQAQAATQSQQAATAAGQSQAVVNAEEKSSGDKTWQVWGKLMIIFSLLWFLSNVVAQRPSALGVFFTLAFPIRYSLMVVLALLSSVTDNVALAAMQGALIINHPFSIPLVRLLFVLLTWSGGFTPFGCLQSLALNAQLQYSTGKWFRQTWVWAFLAIVGGLAGLALIGVLYPTASGEPH